VEPLDRVLAGDVGRVRDQRRVGDVRDEQLVLEALGVGEPQGALGAVRAREAAGPEVQRLLGPDAPEDAMDHPRAGMTGARARELEEGEDRARSAGLVAVVQVVDVRRVEVHRLLHESQPERTGVEVDVALRVGRDRGDVVQPLERHRALLSVREK